MNKRSFCAKLCFLITGFTLLLFVTLPWVSTVAVNENTVMTAEALLATNITAPITTLNNANFFIFFLLLFGCFYLFGRRLKST